MSRALLGILGGIVLFIGAFSIFVVQETEYAVKFRLGEIVATDYEPGLHFKLPFVNNVRKFDRRILFLDMPVEQMNTKEQKYVDVDYFVNWQITDVTAFYTSTQGNEGIARRRLAQIIRDGLREQFARLTLQEVVAEKRADLMENLTTAADTRVQDLGIRIVDVRIKRIELTDRVTDSVFARMETQRTEFANELRSLGREEAERIQSDADRQVSVLLAEAQRDADTLRGEGDARAAEIYAGAYERDAEFYSFLRSLEAYRTSFNGQRDTLVLDPDAPFFEYLKKGAAR
ncbi:MAG: protease modulator HflC [Xanthomonadales bacterium]|nr:protease modulator HflC [Xanthomonadales bacterium]